MEPPPPPLEPRIGGAKGTGRAADHIGILCRGCGAGGGTYGRRVPRMERHALPPHPQRPRAVADGCVVCGGVGGWGGGGCIIAEGALRAVIRPVSVRPSVPPTGGGSGGQTGLHPSGTCGTCSTPAARVRNNPDSKQHRLFIVIGFTTFSHSTPLHCAILPLGTLFSFFEPPPPLANPCVLGLGVGVMGNAGLCSRSAHDLWVPSLLPLHFGAFEGVSKIV